MKSIGNPLIYHPHQRPLPSLYHFSDLLFSLSQLTPSSLSKITAVPHISGKQSPAQQQPRLRRRIPHLSIYVQQTIAFRAMGWLTKILKGSSHKLFVDIDKIHCEAYCQEKCKRLPCSRLNFSQMFGSL